MTSTLANNGASAPDTWATLRSISATYSASHDRINAIGFERRQKHQAITFEDLNRH
jgi:hypothetical protein